MQVMPRFHGGSRGEIFEPHIMMATKVTGKRGSDVNREAPKKQWKQSPRKKADDEIVDDGMEDIDAVTASQNGEIYSEYEVDLSLIINTFKGV